MSGKPVRWLKWAPSGELGPSWDPGPKPVRERAEFPRSPWEPAGAGATEAAWRRRRWRQGRTFGGERL